MEKNNLLLLICVIWGVSCLSDCMNTKKMRRRRRETTCPEGNYTTSTKMTCCRCDKGYYRKSDCIRMYEAAKCEACETDSFMDHPNVAKQCESCKVCLSNANMEIKRACISSSNTVCRCKEQYYCNEDDCKACHACDPCEEFGVKVPCSETNNTRCHDGAQNSVNLSAVIVPIGILFAVAAAAVVVWKKKMFCFHKSTIIQNPEEQEPLQDVDLSPFLSEIAQALGLQAVRDVARHNGVVSDVRIQAEIANHPNDTEEQTFKVLQAWHEQHGMKAAYSGLVSTLRAVRKNAATGKVIKIVTDGQNTSRTTA
ncbi:tumor necrosis factor receptor superfamily member 6 isoform X2 [Trichomycterus rosablanca]|uniref:tumor necrosis factor receptor superfamily member 6 isoform X2 n=1 Tax=Trichomycterus rosablanca TaxID=2290929 RepID=UPI002F34F9AA